jgi:hypothetical protein
MTEDHEDAAFKSLAEGFFRLNHAEPLSDDGIPVPPDPFAMPA